MRLTLLTSLLLLAACDDGKSSTNTPDATAETTDAAADATDSTGPDVDDTGAAETTAPDAADTTVPVDTTGPDSDDATDTTEPDSDDADDADSTDADDADDADDTADTDDDTDTADTADATDIADTADTADTDTQTNAAPVITAGPSSDASSGLPGEKFALTVTATDANNDVLTYTWSQLSPASPLGTFSNAAGDKIDFTLPELAADTTFALRVSVSDGVNTPVTATVNISGLVPSFATDILPIFSVCTGCHGASGGMSLANASAYTNLVNAAGNACDLDRVEPGSPDDSLLVRKISGTSCGARMPRNNQTYFDSNPALITQIRSWILAGAAND